MVWMKEFFDRIHQPWPGWLLLSWLHIEKVNFSVFKKVFTNNPQLSPAAHWRRLGVHLENLRGAWQLGTVDQVGGNLQSFQITTLILNGCFENKSTMGRFTLGLFPGRVIGKPSLNIGKSLFQDSYTVTNVNISTSVLGGEFQDICAIDTCLQTRDWTLASHPANLIKQVRQRFASLSTNKDL